jgi:hypothetical protein
VPEPLASQRGVDGHEHGAEPRAREPQAQDLRAVLAYDGDSVTRGDPGLGERTGEAGRVVTQVGVAPHGVSEAEERSVAVARRRPLELRRQRLLGRPEVEAGR